MDTYEEVGPEVYMLDNMYFTAKNVNEYAKMADDLESGKAELLPYKGSEREAAQDAAETEGLKDEQDRAELRNNLKVRRLLLKRPVKIDKYIDETVTDLESAKDVLKSMARALAVLAKRSL